jgi:SAM-dependent methyltransferase
MLDAMLKIAGASREMKILSVGSGLGLFERPLVLELSALGLISQFTGVDINREANQLLRTFLEQNVQDRLHFEVRDESFENFSDQDQYDLILFNHVFEYLSAGQERWLNKALGMLKTGGQIGLYSPLHDEINFYYAKFQEELFKRSPYFSADIDGLLNSLAKIKFERQTIMGKCDLSLIARSELDPAATKLLSFLCQIDAREFDSAQLHEIRDYFLGVEADNWIAHPTDLYLIQQSG